MRKQFSTPEPIHLYVEIGSGDVSVRADDVDETTVDVEGDGAEDVIVEQRHDQVVVRAPQRRSRLFGQHHDLGVTVTVPSGSALTTQTGSADVSTTGPLGDLSAKSGSGMVRVDSAAGELQVQTGSGDIRLRRADGNLRTKSGSGDVYIERVSGSSALSSGSGSMQVGTAEGELACKSGSGDVRVDSACESLSATTASGDISVGTAAHGSVRLEAVSGRVQVGVQAGVPVWTDIGTVSGRVVSNLAGAGQPADGQPYLELRVSTVSGDVVLEER